MVLKKGGGGGGGLSSSNWPVLRPCCVVDPHLLCWELDLAPLPEQDTVPLLCLLCLLQFITTWVWWLDVGLAFEFW